jgi:cytochrome c peroxidase
MAIAAMMSSACHTPSGSGDPCSTLGPAVRVATTAAPVVPVVTTATEPDVRVLSRKLLARSTRTVPMLVASQRWERENPLRPIEEPPLGMAEYLRPAATATPSRVRLGRWLFYDARLSLDNSISCASCHRPDHAFSAPTRVSPGVEHREGSRKTPTLINVEAPPAWPQDAHALFGWDGRTSSLQQQILGALKNPLEMANAPDAIARKISDVQGYGPYFEEAFGTGTITAEQVAEAIADYVRTRVSGNAPYDRKNAGDSTAVSETVKRGEDLFFDKARCNLCHMNGNFTNGKFHNLGIGWDPSTNTFRDPGRILVTGRPNDRGAFKVPGLRDVSHRGPYMHDGSLQTLRDVVDFYNRGGIVNPCLAPQIRPLNLSDAESAALVAFLESLSGEGYQDTPPRSFPQ